MSKQLRLSATLSVALMSLYVLFGNASVEVPLGPETSLDSSLRAAAPGLPSVGDWHIVVRGAD